MGEKDGNWLGDSIWGPLTPTAEEKEAMSNETTIDALSPEERKALAYAAYFTLATQKRLPESVDREAMASGRAKLEGMIETEAPLASALRACADLTRPGYPPENAAEIVAEVHRVAKQSEAPTVEGAVQ